MRTWRVCAGTENKMKHVDDKLYAILKPVDFEAFGIKEDEALVYSVEYDMDFYEDYLERVTDEVDIEIIFQMYYDLCDEQGIE